MFKCNVSSFILYQQLYISYPNCTDVFRTDDTPYVRLTIHRSKGSKVRAVVGWTESPTTGRRGNLTLRLPAEIPPTLLWIQRSHFHVWRKAWSGQWGLSGGCVPHCCTGEGVNRESQTKMEPVCQCVHEEEQCVCTCHFYTLLFYIPMSDVWWGQHGMTHDSGILPHPPHTYSFMAMPHVSPLYLEQSHTFFNNDRHIFNKLLGSSIHNST